MYFRKQKYFVGFFEAVGVPCIYYEGCKPNFCVVTSVLAFYVTGMLEVRLVLKGRIWLSVMLKLLFYLLK